MIQETAHQKIAAAGRGGHAAEASRTAVDESRFAAEAHRRLLAAAIGVVGFALATGLAAQVKFFLPGTPVPVTAQTLTVVLAGVVLGPRLGTLSMGFYLLLGMTGYHMFALTSGWGLATVLSATGGYLLGFVLAQPVIGLIRPERPRSGLGRRRAWETWLRLAAAVLAGHAVIFASGLAWLAVWTGAGPAAVLAMGLWPFVPGTVIKSLAAMGLGRAMLPLRRRWFEHGG